MRFVGPTSRQSAVPVTEAAGRLRTALAHALESDANLARRLCRTDTSVRFTVAAQEAMTLLLDQDPPRVAGGDEPAEIEIALTPEQTTGLAVGQFPLAAAVFAGVVAVQGPARAYLEVDPILQGMLAGPAARGERVRIEPSRADRSQGRAKETPADGATADETAADLLAIETRGLVKSFGSSRVLHGVDLRIPEGVISVVLGPSGTGKSVLFQHLIGLLSPDAGEVRLRGRSVGAMRRSQLMGLRRDVGVMFQDGALFSAMTVHDNVAFPLREHTDLRDREIREVVLARLHDVGLADAAHQFPRELSGGMRKRAGLARALVLDPRILLCDEPDSGLDPVRTALIGNLICDQHARGGGVVLVVTHDIDLARQIADHVSVLWDGTIVQSGLAADVFASQNPFVRQFLDGGVEGPLQMD
jgi:ABC-type transporter Mla maintaining outer membrane lipid asymmetry ATPase subunit MlaF